MATPLEKREARSSARVSSHRSDSSMRATVRRTYPAPFLSCSCNGIKCGCGYHTKQRTGDEHQDTQNDTQKRERTGGLVRSHGPEAEEGNQTKYVPHHRAGGKADKQHSRRDARAGRRTLRCRYHEAKHCDAEQRHERRRQAPSGKPCDVPQAVYLRRIGLLAPVLYAPASGGSIQRL